MQGERWSNEATGPAPAGEGRAAELLTLAVEHAPCGIGVVDDRLRLVAANRALRGLTGPPSREAWRVDGLLHGVLERGVPVHDCEVTRAAAADAPVRVSYYPVHVAGRAAAVGVVVHGRADERGSRVAECSAREILEHAPDPVLLWRRAPTREVELVNGAMSALAGVPREEATGTPDRLLRAVHDDDRAAFERLLAAAPPPDPALVRFVHGDGRVVWAECRAAALPTRAAVQVTARDVTAWKHALELQELTMAVLGHDLRNPLSAILMTATHMLRRGDLPPSIGPAIARIAQSGARMNAMVEQLVAFARLRRGGTLPMERRPTDLRAVCSQVIDECRAADPRACIRCRCSGDATGAWDPDRLAQALSNLIGNAMRHGDLDRPIHVVIRGLPDQVRLSVHNHGEPISRERQRDLFDPFHGSTRRAASGGPGLGLGLFIVREIVVAHGGRVMVTSSRRRGTRIAIALPRGW